MSSDVAVAVRGLSKAYTIAHDGDRPSTLGETLLQRIRQPFRRVEQETFWALCELSFEIKRGEVVGVIGRNGAGKSTLLKILSRITEPTEGEVDLFGRVGSLLEVGTGFHPELTGRENIFLNGAILGMTKAEIRAQFDAIVDFAGVERFIDTPVKRYSSGMYVRLAFAVAAHLNPEILIVDEVLAVGDLEFQKKCMGKMRDVATGGRTVLFVSHNTAAIRSLCTEVIFLEKGRVRSISEPLAAIGEYLRATDAQRQDSYEGEGGLRLWEAGFRTPAGEDAGTTLEFGKDYQLTMNVDSPQPIRGALGLSIWDDEGTKISSIQSIEEGCDFWDLSRVRRIVCDLPQLSLLPGTYHVSLELCDQHVAYLKAENVIRFSVEPRCLDGSGLAYGKSHGVYRIARGVRAVEHGEP